LAASNAHFQVANGAITAPDGGRFFAKGLNLSDSQMGDAAQILAAFPGLNFVRLAIHTYDSPDTYAAFIKTMTDRGVVVALEDHTNTTGDDSGGARGEAFTGNRLIQELSWYSAVAEANAANPYVWFGTDNEPPPEGLTAWQKATYDAIRDAGNAAPILIELPGGAWPDLDYRGYGMDPVVYQKMVNIVADIHYYGWEAQFSTDQQVVNRQLSQLITYAKELPSGSGTLPVILGEYGPSTDGQDDDANAMQSIQAAQQSTATSGAVAFAWHAGANDNLVDSQGALTAFGHRVAQYIAQTPAPVTVDDVVAADANGLSGLGVEDATMNFVAASGDGSSSAAATPAPEGAPAAVSWDAASAATSDLSAAPPAAPDATYVATAADAAAAAASTTDSALQVLVPQIQT